MTEYEKKKIELELRDFSHRHFEKPANCRNPEQVRYYVHELSLRIEAIKKEYNHVPEWAYSLLAQYNAVQNSMIREEFRNAYGASIGG